MPNLESCLDAVGDTLYISVADILNAFWQLPVAERHVDRTAFVTPRQASLARKFAPLADRILVRRLVAKTQTAGGIYLPDSKLGKTNEGEVVAVGPGRVTETGTKVPVNVVIGDTVLLPEYGGQTLTLGDEELSLFRDEDILGKFQG
eukprot:jgi/Undpi1/678/HiC_scaffold_10.g04142.m1